MNGPISHSHTRAPEEPTESVFDAERGYEVVIHDGPLPERGGEPLTEAEQAFHAAVAGAGEPGSLYTRWAEKARAGWHKRTRTPVRRAEA